MSTLCVNEFIFKPNLWISLCENNDNLRAPDCHLCLANYNLSSLNNQKCSFISSHHATIFYDDWTQHYELIKYSEYGTRVDGIIYGNDIDRKLIYIPESSDLVHRVRNLIKTAPKKLSSNYETSSVISELCASPPKRLMKMLSKRHEVSEIYLFDIYFYYVNEKELFTSIH
ncbi:unnamed protein product [Schistosoma haematobium]|nr:unnamed protein product [Schistosoma haematobium]